MLLGLTNRFSGILVVIGLIGRSNGGEASTNTVGAREFGAFVVPLVGVAVRSLDWPNVAEREGSVCDPLAGAGNDDNVATRDARPMVLHPGTDRVFIFLRMDVF